MTKTTDATWKELKKETMGPPTTLTPEVSSIWHFITVPETQESQQSFPKA
jgi:hypothetical protein